MRLFLLYAVVQWYRIKQLAEWRPGPWTIGGAAFGALAAAVYDYFTGWYEGALLMGACALLGGVIALQRRTIARLHGLVLHVALRKYSDFLAQLEADMDVDMFSDTQRKDRK